MLFALFKKELYIQARNWKIYNSGIVYILALEILAFSLIWSISTSNASYNPEHGQKMFSAFFSGFVILTCLICPIFIANSISSEINNQTFYQLKLTLLNTRHIIIAKAGLGFFLTLILLFISLPIIILMMPLGDISWLKIGPVYLIILNIVIAFILMSLAFSSIFKNLRKTLSGIYITIGFFLLGTELIPLTMTEIFKIKSKYLQIIRFLDPARAVLNSLDINNQPQIFSISPWILAISGYTILSLISIIIILYRIRRIN